MVFVLYPPLPASGVQLHRTSTWNLTAQLEVSRDWRGGEIKGRVMNKVPAPRSLGFGLGHSEVTVPSALGKTPLFAVSGEELSALFPSWLATASLKPLHGMVAWGQTEKRCLCPPIYLLGAAAPLQ